MDVGKATGHKPKEATMTTTKWFTYLLNDVRNHGFHAKGSLDGARWSSHNAMKLSNIVFFDKYERGKVV